MQICTVCDSKYIHKGLALYQSLKNVIPDQFVLHWLCADNIIYEQLDRLDLHEISLYKLSALEDLHPELRVAKNNPPSNYGTQHSQYMWTLTPWFINYLLRKEQDWGPEFPGLLYADSDIFFYHSPAVIAEIVGSKAVGIHTHRFSGREQDFQGDNGWYNVGVLYFNNTLAGLNISENWKKWLLDGPAGPFYKTYGTCGDQKFLELFRPLFGEQNVCVFDDPGLIQVDSKIYHGVCHQAPWCTDSCGKDPVLFYHFSHFVFNLEKNFWEDHMENPMEWNPSAAPGIRTLYDQYFAEMKRADALLQSAPAILPQPEIVTANKQPVDAQFEGKFLDIVGNIKVDEANPERVRMLIACIRSFAFLKDHCRFILLMEKASASLTNRVRKELQQIGFDFTLLTHGFGDYGKSYSTLLKTCNAPYILNFLEDHFCMCDSVEQVVSLVSSMKKLHIDLIKTSFHQVELNSIQAVDLFYDDNTIKVYDNNIITHAQYEKYYQHRYFISVHFLCTRAFALKFWNRHLGEKPHEYEIVKFTPGWEHRVAVPAIEFVESIDDHHGVPGNNLLDRTSAGKFRNIYNMI